MENKQELVSKIKRVVIPVYMLDTFSKMYYIRKAGVADLEDEIRYLWGWSVEKDYKTDGDEIYRMIYTVDKFLNCDFLDGMSADERSYKKSALECFFDIIFTVGEDPDNDKGWIIQPFLGDEARWNKKVELIRNCKRYKVLFDKVEEERNERIKYLKYNGFIPEDLPIIKQYNEKYGDKRFKDRDIIMTHVESGKEKRFSTRKEVIDYCGIPANSLTKCIQSTKGFEDDPKKWSKWKKPGTSWHFTFREILRTTKYVITNEL